MSSFIIKNISPCENLNFLCNDQIVFSMLTYYKRPLEMMLTAYTFCYKTDVLFDTYKLKFSTELDVYRKMKLCMKKECFSQDLLEKIKAKINLNIPVGITVYRSYNSNKSNKISGMDYYFHHVLVYGYDDYKKCFLVLDHDYYNSFKYKFKELQYDEVLTILEGYYAWNNNNKTNMFYYYYFVETGFFNLSLDKMRSEYKENHKRHETQIRTGINSFQILSVKLIDLITYYDSSNMREIENCVNHIKMIHNQKSIINYLIKYLYGDRSKESNLSDHILRCYRELSGILGRIAYAGLISPNIIEDTRIDLKLIFDYENAIIDKLCE